MPAPYHCHICHGDYTDGHSCCGIITPCGPGCGANYFHSEQRLRSITAKLLDVYLSVYGEDTDDLATEARYLVPDWKSRAEAWQPKHKLTQT